jgi:hypothetical protein
MVRFAQLNINIFVSSILVADHAAEPDHRTCMPPTDETAKMAAIGRPSVGGYSSYPFPSLSH